MSRRAVHVFAIVFLVAQAVAITWPFATLINDPSVRVLGLPLPFAWTAGWVAATFFVMGWVWTTDRDDTPARDHTPARDDGPARDGRGATPDDDGRGT